MLLIKPEVARPAAHASAPTLPALANQVELKQLTNECHYYVFHMCLPRQIIVERRRRHKNKQMHDKVSNLKTKVDGKIPFARFDIQASSCQIW